MWCLLGLQRLSSYMCSRTISTQHLYTAAPYTAHDEKLAGNEGRVQGSGAIRASCTKQATGGVKQWASSISPIHTQTRAIYSFASTPHLHPAHAVSEAWCRYVFLVFEGVAIYNDRGSPAFLEGYVTMKLKPDYRSPCPGLWCVHTVRILFTSDVNDVITETRSDLIWVLIKTYVHKQLLLMHITYCRYLWTQVFKGSHSPLYVNLPEWCPSISTFWNNWPSYDLATKQISKYLVTGYVNFLTLLQCINILCVICIFHGECQYLNTFST